MKCGYCNGTGEHINDANRMTTCEFCGGTGEVAVTNEEWLERLTTEEKAKWFCDHITCSDGCRFYGKCVDEQMGRELWQEWLKQPHREI